MKRILFLFILVSSLMLASCGGITEVPTQATSVPVSATPDLCAQANIAGEIAKANKLMREFDDYSALASNTPQAQLITIIPDMQRIVRDTQDLEVPACLQDLKKYEIGHMKLVVQVLIAFLNTASADPQSITTGIEQARQLHAKYDIEMARLLGITLVAPPTRTPLPADPNGTPAAAVPTVTNNGPAGVNLRGTPSLDGPEAGILGAQISAKAIGKSADAQWIKVEIPSQPGQFAWVFASLVQLSVPIEQLPVTQ